MVPRDTSKPSLSRSAPRCNTVLNFLISRLRAEFLSVEAFRKREWRHPVELCNSVLVGCILFRPLFDVYVWVCVVSPPSFFVVSAVFCICRGFLFLCFDNASVFYCPESHDVEKRPKEVHFFSGGGGYKKCCYFAAISTNFVTTWHEPFSSTPVGGGRYLLLPPPPPAAGIFFLSSLVYTGAKPNKDGRKGPPDARQLVLLSVVGQDLVVNRLRLFIFFRCPYAADAAFWSECFGRRGGESE